MVPSTQAIDVADQRGLHGIRMMLETPRDGALTDGFFTDGWMGYCQWHGWIFSVLPMHI